MDLEDILGFEPVATPAAANSGLGDLLGFEPAAPASKPAAAKPAAAKPAASTSSNADSGFELSSMKEHIKKKGMWAGGLQPIQIPDLLGATRGTDPETKEPTVALSELTRAHTPALLKIFDEVLVNASDHWKGQEKKAAGQRVTHIDILFDKRTGAYSVQNNGTGIPITLHAKATALAGTPVYIPEVAFAYFLAGTNIEKDLSNVKGGINGLGAKIANVHSVLFEVETADATKLYRQTWRDRLDVTEPPVIVSLKDAGLTAAQRKEHTLVRFTPAYRELGYRLSADGALPPPDAAELDAWICLRAHQTAAYVGPKVTVTYNGQRCATTSAADLAALLGGDEEGTVILAATAKAKAEPFKQHEWEIAVVLLPPGRKAGRRAAAQNMTVINGVLSNKGAHIQYVKKMISTAVEDKIRKATKKAKADDKAMSVTETLSGVRLVMCAPVPGADWGGQRKDELQVPKSTLEHYVIAPAALKKLGDAIAEHLLMAQGGGKAAKVHHDKYYRAGKAGGKDKAHTYLMAAEGDSAIKLLRAGLTQSKAACPPGGPSLEWCGIISLQGVVMNAARQVTEVATASGAKVQVRSAKLQTNKRLLALADAFGLRYDRTYETAEELATLNYGKLLLCVDEDLDGTGKIAPLVLVWLYQFWPALFRHGRVGRFITPLVRAYPKRGAGEPVEFYYEEVMRAWLDADPARADAHTIKYYKGLATHTAPETKRMFTAERFRASIYTYTPDESTKRLFEVYFGASPALRKVALVTPVEHLPVAEALALDARHEIPLGRVQLDVNTKAYKNDAILRQIPGAIDGLNPARRKILLGAAMRFAKEPASKELKVFQLGGYVADKVFYHHGNDSLNNTIIYLAQSFFGARRYPYLLASGQFGTRHNHEAGSPRYISVLLSPLMRRVLPPADRWFLPYVFEDGERAEPRYFVPVVPMAVLESGDNVSEGWNHDSHGRDPAAVLAVVLAYIAGDAELHALAARLAAEGPTPAVLRALAAAEARWPLPINLAGFDGDVRDYKGEPHSFGAYTWDPAARLVNITELPIGAVTDKFIEKLTAETKSGAPNQWAQYLEGEGTDIDRSTETKVDLRVRLRDGAFDAICAKYGDAVTDPIEAAFGLRTNLRPHLNYYAANGGVVEFGECYLAPILYWAPVRARLYGERLHRERAVAALQIVEEEQTLRYIPLAAELDLASHDDEDAASAVLAARGFVRLDTALLHRPEYTPNSELAALVTDGAGASYNYLLNLRERDLVKRAVDTRHKRLAGLRAELERVDALLAERPIPGMSIWLAEIAEFRKLTGV